LAKCTLESQGISKSHVSVDGKASNCAKTIEILETTGKM
jgi:hypothetical protein